MNHSANFIFSVSLALAAALASGTAFGDEPNQKLDPARLAVSASDSDAPQTVRTTDGRELKLVWNDSGCVTYSSLVIPPFSAAF